MPVLKLKKWFYFIIIIVIIAIIFILNYSDNQSNQTRKSSDLYTYEILCEAKYDRIVSNIAGLIVVEYDNKYGCLTEDNSKSIPFIYDFIEIASEKQLIVVKDKVYGVIDLNGDVIIPFKYSRILKEGDYYHVFENEKSYYLDNNNECVTQNEMTYTETETPYNWYYRREFNSNILSVNGVEKMGITDKNGLQIVPCEYIKIRISESENRFIVKNENGKEGVIKCLKKEND